MFMIYFCYFRLARSSLSDPMGPNCRCGQQQETMVTSGPTQMSSCPTRHLSGWPSRERWAETCGPTSPWMTSPSLRSVWLEVKPSFFATSSNHNLLSFPLFTLFFVCKYSCFALAPFPYEFFADPRGECAELMESFAQLIHINELQRLGQCQETAKTAHSVCLWPRKRQITFGSLSRQESWTSPLHTVIGQTIQRWPKSSIDPPFFLQCLSLRSSDASASDLQCRPVPVRLRPPVHPKELEVRRRARLRRQIRRGVLLVSVARHCPSSGWLLRWTVPLFECPLPAFHTALWWSRGLSRRRRWERMPWVLFVSFETNTWFSFHSLPWWWRKTNVVKP